MPPPWPGWRRMSSSPWGARTPPKPVGVEDWDPPTPPPHAVSGGMVGAGLGQAPWIGGQHRTPPGTEGMGRWQGRLPILAPVPPSVCGQGGGCPGAVCPPCATPCPWDPRFYTVVCRIKVMLEGLVVRVLQGGCGHNAMAAGTA